MKPNVKLGGKNSKVAAARTAGPTQPNGETVPSAKADVPKRFRLLKWDEMVSRGDFVEDEHQGFELWEGPTGFRANSFVKPIYRQDENHSTSTKKAK